MGAGGAGSLQAAHLRSELLAVSAIRSTHFLRAFRRWLTLSATCHASVQVVRMPPRLRLSSFSRRSSNDCFQFRMRACQWRVPSRAFSIRTLIVIWVCGIE